MNLKIVDKKKFFRSILLLVIVLTFIYQCFFYTSSSEEIHNYKTIIVSDGDTLWSIAEYEKKENSMYRDSDIRDIVQSIKKVNNLKTSALTINQNLIIPVA